MDISTIQLDFIQNVIDSTFFVAFTVGFCSCILFTNCFYFIFDRIYDYNNIKKNNNLVEDYLDNIYVNNEKDFK